MPEEPIFNLRVAGTNIRFLRVDSNFSIRYDGSEKHFLVRNSLASPDSFINYDGRIIKRSINEFPNWVIVFKGKPWGNYESPYNWHVAISDKKVAIHINFIESNDLNNACIVIDPELKTVDLLLDSKESQYEFFPYLNPIGVLLQIYLLHFAGGFMLHGSSVVLNDMGFVFSGLSGIGKSTMAGLWQQQGATVINDDRLAIMPFDNGFHAHNTPMPYYDDYPKFAPIKALFLLEQSTQHTYRKLSRSEAVVRVMANCMQHFHTSDYVIKHIEILTEFVNRVPVYHLGFTPTADVVDFVLKLIENDHQ